MSQTNYARQTKIDAADMAREFLDRIVEAIQADADDLEDLKDFRNEIAGADDYHHSSHVDKDWRPAEAIELLNQLSEHEETDSGLWEGLDSWDLILGTIAAYTYGNAVEAEWNNFIDELAGAVSDAISDFETDDEDEGWEDDEDRVRALVLETINDFDPETAEDDGPVHLKPTRGTTAVCGAESGNQDADLNAVTCERCREIHEDEQLLEYVERTSPDDWRDEDKRRLLVLARRGLRSDC